MNKMAEEKPKLTVESMETEKENSLSVPFAMYNTNKSTQGCLFCFVEGKSDTDYYFSKVKNIYGSNNMFINCYNKKQVLKMYEEIHDKDKDTQKLAFFIDHDYDNMVCKEHLYETECYSIENYYVCEESFSDFLQYGLHVEKSSTEYHEAMNFYRDEFQKFHGVMLDFNAWIAVCKAKNITQQMIHLEKLGDSVPDGFLVKEIGGNYTQVYDLSALNRHFNAEPLITEEEINAKRQELSGKDYYKIFRGKYEFHFLCELLHYLHYNATHKKRNKRAVLEKSIASWNINESKLMIYLSDYAYFPKNLNDFIRSYIA